MNRQAMAIADEESKLPLYAQLAMAVKADIVQGRYPVGSLIPTEEELCRRFSVSRHTVREALRVLREEGLVSSRRGAGTVVVPLRSREADIHRVMSINDLLAFGADTRFVIESMKMATIDRKQAERTGLAQGTTWLQIVGLRLTQDGDKPVGLSEYYINAKYAAVGRLLPRHEGPIFPLIEDMFGQRVTEVHQQIAATLVTKALAVKLAAKEGSPALEIRRIYKAADGCVLQLTMNIHPAARYRHSMVLQRFIKTG